MKAVKQISTNKILYKSKPDFETGKGIINVKSLFPSISVADMIEINLSETELAVEANNNLIKDFDVKIQAHLDAVAKARGYDNIMSACCYAAAPNTYQTEGQAFIQWRAAVWEYCYQVMADVENGLRTIPTISSMVAELPIMEG